MRTVAHTGAHSGATRARRAAPSRPAVSDPDADLGDILSPQQRAGARHLLLLADPDMVQAMADFEATGDVSGVKRESCARPYTHARRREIRRGRSRPPPCPTPPPARAPLTPRAPRPHALPTPPPQAWR